MSTCSHWTAWLHPLESLISTGQWGSVHTGQPEYTSFSPKSLHNSEYLFTLDILNTPPSVLNHYKTVSTCSHWTAWLHPFSPQSLQDSEGLFTLDSLNTPPSVLNQHRTVRASSHWAAWIHLPQSSISTGQWGSVHTGQPEYTFFSPESLQDIEGLFTLDSLNRPPSVLNHYRTMRVCSHWTAWIHLLQSSISTGQWESVHTGQTEYTSFSPQSVSTCSNWTALIHLLQSSITTGQWGPVHTGQP